MKKILCFFLLLTASLCTFTACSSDDDGIFYDASGNTFSSSQLVGTWYNSDWGTVTLKSNGTASFGNSVVDMNGYWSVSGNKLTLSGGYGGYSGSITYYIVSVSDTKIVVKEEDEDSYTETFCRKK